MLTATEKSIILFGVLVLMRPPVYAQSDLLLFRVPSLSEKESVFPQRTVPEQPTFEKIVPLLSADKKELMNVIDYDEFFFATSLRSFASLSKPTFHFENFYEKSDHAFWNFIEKRVLEDMRKKREEKKIIREAWKEWLGVDIWYPYFKAKEIEDWIKDRFRVKIFRFKGRLQFEKERLTYTFRMRF
ncbi:MAG: hypothetical protein AMJ95_05440 [Omnitrophica WOR_2 bacterium SM23_72]|nr:MAG: hypothetical protein AMJ95_05440 [Omnitrophica WOR_2 bacterium SM23_72]